MKTTNARFCPKCATVMRPFEDGSKTGWVCPSCGEVVCRRTPQGYCLILAGVVAFVGVLLALLFPNIGAVLFLAALWAGLLVLLAVIVFVPVYVCYWWLRNRSRPETRTVATVARKRTRDWEVDVPRNLDVSPWSMVMNQVYDALGVDRGVTVAQWDDYFVTFKTDRAEVELAVPEETYVDLQEGERGLLVYQGEIFRHFIRGVTG